MSQSYLQDQNDSKIQLKYKDNQSFEGIKGSQSVNTDENESYVIRSTKKFQQSQLFDEQQFEKIKNTRQIHESDIIYEDDYSFQNEQNNESIKSENKQNQAQIQKNRTNSNTISNNISSNNRIQKQSMTLSQNTENSANILDQYMNYQENTPIKDSVKKYSYSIKSPVKLDHIQSESSYSSKSQNEINNINQQDNQSNNNKPNYDVNKSPHRFMNNSSEEGELKSVKRRALSKSQKNFKSTKTIINRQSRKSMHTKKQLWSFTQFITIIVFVQKFIRIMADKQKAIKIVNSLKQPVFETINDIVYFTEQQLKQDKEFANIQEHKNVKGFFPKLIVFCQLSKTSIIQCFSKLWYAIPTLQPNQKLKVFMDCWQSFWILYRMFFTTVKFSFFLVDIRKSTNLVSYEILMIINISFIFDMLINFHTGYYVKGTIEQSKKLIAKKYFQSSLLSDIIVQVPLILAYFVNENSSYNLIVALFVIDILIFLKWFGLKSTFNRLEIVFTENEKIAQLFPLITLSMQVLIIAHIVGLLYHGVAVFEIEILGEREQTWLHLQQLVHNNWLDKYLHSLYWAVSTMVTILLYVPETNVETLFAITSIFLMTGIFGYALNTIGMILTDISKKSKEHKNDRQMANRFFKKRKIPEKLRERIILYLEFQYQQQQEKNEEEEGKIIGKLSKQLQSQIIQEINQSYMDKFSMINNQFSAESKAQILELIQEEHYSPDEQITKKTDSLFVLLEGSAEVYVQRGKHSNQMQIYKVQKDQVFGTYSFITGQILPYKVKSLESCLILKIDRSNFLKIIKENENDYQHFCQLKDTMVQNFPLENIKVDMQLDSLLCDICSNNDHQSHECKFVNYRVDQIQLIYDYNNLDTQLRGQFNRFEEKNYNSYDIFQEINIIVKQEIFSDDPNVDEELKSIALQWKQFYEQVIPAQDFDTNSQMEQQSFYTNKSLNNINTNQQKMYSEYDESEADVSKQSILYEKHNANNTSIELSNQNNRNRRRQSKLLSLKGAGSLLNNTVASQQINPNSQQSGFNQNIQSSHMTAINSQLNTINERKTGSSYTQTQTSNNQMTQSNNTANLNNTNSQSYTNIPIIQTTNVSSNIPASRRRQSVQRRQSLFMENGIKAMRLQQQIQQIQQQQQLNQSSQQADSSINAGISGSNSNLALIVEQSEPSNDNLDKRIRKSSNTGLQGQVASNLNLNASQLNYSLNIDQSDQNFNKNKKQNNYPQFSLSSNQKPSNNKHQISNNQNDTSSIRNKRKVSGTVADILNPNNFSVINNNNNYNDEKVDKMMNNSMQYQQIPTQNSFYHNQSYYDKQNDTQYINSHYSRYKSQTQTTINMPKSNNNHYLPNISKELTNLRKINDWDFCTFDKPKTLEIYLPHNNFQEVMKNLKKYQKNILQNLSKDPIKNKVVMDLISEKNSSQDEDMTTNNQNNNIIPSFNAINQNKMKNSSQIGSGIKLVQTPQFTSQLKNKSNNQNSDNISPPNSGIIVNQSQSNRISQASLINSKQYNSGFQSSLLNNPQFDKRGNLSNQNQNQRQSGQSVTMVPSQSQFLNDKRFSSASNSHQIGSHLFNSQNHNHFGGNSSTQNSNSVIPSSIMGNKINNQGSSKNIPLN